MNSTMNELKYLSESSNGSLEEKCNEELEAIQLKPVNGLMPPSNPIYAPYIEAVKKTSNYAINEKGHYCSFDSKGNPFELSNFVARPTKEITRDDGEAVERTIRIEGILSNGRPQPTIDLSIEEFASMNWAMPRWGIQASIKPGNNKKDMCRDAIQSMAQDIEKEHIYTHLGYRKLEHEGWIYLYNGGCIRAENISVDIEKTLSK